MQIDPALIASANLESNSKKGNQDKKSLRSLLKRPEGGQSISPVTKNTAASRAFVLSTPEPRTTRPLSIRADQRILVPDSQGAGIVSPLFRRNNNSSRSVVFETPQHGRTRPIFCDDDILVADSLDEDGPSQVVSENEDSVDINEELAKADIKKPVTRKRRSLKNVTANSGYIHISHY